MEQVESAPLRATRDPPSEGAELWNFIAVGDRFQLCSSNIRWSQLGAQEDEI